MLDASTRPVPSHSSVPDPASRGGLVPCEPKLRVLIVDDSAYDRAFVRELVDESCEVVGASTGAEGLERCLSSRPDCVLLDVRLPGDDGLHWLPDFVRERVPVVMLTGWSDRGTAVQALRLGAHDYLSKDDLTEERLLGAIHRAMKKVNVEAELEITRGLLASVPIGLMTARIHERRRPAPVLVEWANPAAEWFVERLDEPGSDLRLLLSRCALRSLERGGAALELVTRPGPEPTHHELRATPLTEWSVAFLLEEVTERERARAANETLALRLEQTERLETVGKLASAVAHDLSNLLVVVQTYALLLREDLPPNEPRFEDVQAILESVERAHALTRRLQGYGRADRRTDALVDASAVVDGLCGLLRPLLGVSVTLVTHLEPEPHPVRSDIVSLERALVNLCLNARDAMPDGGELLIATANVELSSGDLAGAEANGGTYVRIRVADTGTGMDEETQERVFAPFFSTKPEDEGTGLGLFTVSRVIERANGFIRLESAPGAGTTFDLYLPRAAPTTDDERSPP